MVKKYIVELESGTHIFVLGPEGITHIGEPDVVYGTVDGMQIGDAVINAKPYTEPDLEQVRKEAYDKGYDDAAEEIGSDEQAIADKAYKNGLSDAWEAARTLWNTPNRKEIFGHTAFLTALTALTAQETIEKIRQYEQKKEMDGLRQNIQTIVDQCGYTLDEIAEVLEKMRGEQDG